jgi:hypothetical protein
VNTIVTLSHLGITALTPDQLEDLREALESVLEINVYRRRKFLEVSNGFALISVDDGTIVDCPTSKTGDCIGTEFVVFYRTTSITTSSPTFTKGKGGKSGKGTSPPTIPGATLFPRRNIQVSC